MARRVLANLVAILVIALAFVAVVSVKVFTNSLDEEYSQKCLSKNLSLACNANLDWRHPVEAAACAGDACSLGDVWGIPSLALASGNQSPVMEQILEKYSL